MRFPDNFQIEKDIYIKRGCRSIAGVDEVGRGPLAGPLVAAAVILDIKKLLRLEESTLRNNDVESGEKDFYKDITDSKIVTPLKRLKINAFLLKECISYSTFVISNAEIDKRGMSRCIPDAFERAVEGLGIKPDFIITDFVKIRSWDTDRQLNISAGDVRSITVGAASIIAKVYRDELMIEEDKRFPVYGFSLHKGYGTKKHLEALHAHGPCEIHRKSFRPVCHLVNS